MMNTPRWYEKAQTHWELSFESIFSTIVESKNDEWLSSLQGKTVADLLAEYQNQEEYFSREPRLDEQGMLPWMDFTKMDVANHRSVECKGMQGCHRGA